MFKLIYLSIITHNIKINKIHIYYIMYQAKYNKYNAKCIKQFGGKKKKQNIIILHNPTIFYNPEIPEDTKDMVKQLKKYGKVYNYFFKFSYYANKFTLDDLEYENVAKDIYEKYKDLDNILIIALSHACPYGLYFSNKYSKICNGIICYPFRYYSQMSYERRIWKLKNNKGFESLVKNKKYDVDKHLFEINEERFSKLFDNNPDDDEKQIIYLVFDVSIQRQHYKIPKKFKIPTYLYTRLDMDVSSIIKWNYDRTDISKMKQILSKDDALFQSSLWNFDRVKYDAELKEINSDNLHIKYLISGWEDLQDVVDNVKILFMM
jgi:hypothetical protein